MFGMLQAMAVPQSSIFNSYDDLILELNRGMERDGYRVVKQRTHRAKGGAEDADGEPNEVVRCDLVCHRGGRPYKCMATKHKTKTKKTDCPWRAKAVKRKTVGGWVLTIHCDEHNHEPEPAANGGRAPSGTTGNREGKNTGTVLYAAEC